MQNVGKHHGNDGMGAQSQLERCNQQSSVKGLYKIKVVNTIINYNHEILLYKDNVKAILTLKGWENDTGRFLFEGSETMKRSDMLLILSSFQGDKSINQLIRII